MANQLFPKGRQGFLDGTIDWDTAVIAAALVRGYTVDTTDSVVSDVTAAATLVQSQSFTAKTVTDGIADGNDITFTNITGSVINHIIVYQASAVTGGATVLHTAARLIGVIDTGTGLTGGVTPNGGNITVTWDNGANKIFKL